MGSASIAQIFKVKDPRSKQIKMIPVAGSRVTQGELERKYKYRVVRGEKVLQDNLKIHSMKKLQLDVTKVEKGQECGVAFDNFEGDLQPGDVIECYKDTEGKVTKFNKKAGVHQSY
jgi:translation initiation factor IF-2